MHVEDMKNPAEVQLPGSDFPSVALCVKVSRNRALFALPGDIPLYLFHSPEITSKRKCYQWVASRKCTSLVRLTSSAA